MFCSLPGNRFNVCGVLVEPFYQNPWLKRAGDLDVVNVHTFKRAIIARAPGHLLGFFCMCFNTGLTCVGHLGTSKVTLSFFDDFACSDFLLTRV